MVECFNITNELQTFQRSCVKMKGLSQLQVAQLPWLLNSEGVSWECDTLGNTAMVQLTHLESGAHILATGIPESQWPLGASRMSKLTLSSYCPYLGLAFGTVLPWPWVCCGGWFRAFPSHVCTAVAVWSGQLWMKELENTPENKATMGTLGNWCVWTEVQSSESEAIIWTKSTD